MSANAVDPPAPSPFAAATTTHYRRDVLRAGLQDATGQVTSENAVTLGAIAVGCLVLIAVLAQFVTGLLEDPGQPHARPVPQARSAPPSASLPTSRADCLNGGWRIYGGFESQAGCVAFVTGSAP